MMYLLFNRKNGQVANLSMESAAKTAIGEFGQDRLLRDGLEAILIGNLRKMFIGEYVYVGDWVIVANLKGVTLDDLRDR